MKKIKLIGIRISRDSNVMQVYMSDRYGHKWHCGNLFMILNDPSERNKWCIVRNGGVINNLGISLNENDYMRCVRKS